MGKRSIELYSALSYDDAMERLKAAFGAAQPAFIESIPVLRHLSQKQTVLGEFLGDGQFRLYDCATKGNGMQPAFYGELIEEPGSRSTRIVGHFKMFPFMVFWYCVWSFGLLHSFVSLLCKYSHLGTMPLLRIFVPHLLAMIITAFVGLAGQKQKESIINYLKDTVDATRVGTAV